MNENNPLDRSASVESRRIPSEARLLNLFDTMTLGVVYQDSNGVLTSANPAAQRMLVLSLDQLCGRSAADPRWRALRDDGSEMPIEEQPAIIALRTGKPVINKVMGIFDPINEQTRWLSVTSNPQLGEDLVPREVYSMIEDISERRAAEAALESISDAVVSLDRDWFFTFLNTPAARMLGRSRSDLLGKNIWEMFPTTIGTVSDIEYHRAIDEQVSVTFEQYYVPSNEWFEVRAQPTRNGLTVFFQIITKRKLAEKAIEDSLVRLRESEQRLSLALETGSLGSYDLDIEADEFLSVTPTFKTLFGYAPDAHFTRADSLRAVHPEDLAGVREAFMERCRTGRTTVVDLRVVWPDRSIHWLRSHGMTLFEGGEPKRMIGTTRDITEQKQAEESRREAAERQNNLMRDMLLNVTGGKLRLVNEESELPELLSIVGDPIPLTATSGLSELRQQIKDASSKLDFPECRAQDLTIGASETGMNAIVHGGGFGNAIVSLDLSDRIQVRVRDWGSGINRENLPKATLARGWSTTTSLGFGLVMTLEAVDYLYLRTGPTGTTVVIEQCREEPPPAWL